MKTLNVKLNDMKTRVIAITVVAAFMASFQPIMVAADEEEIPKEVMLAAYKKNCASCHGMDGKGKTRMGKKSGAKDYSDAKVIADIKKKKEEVVFKHVKEGMEVDGKEKMKPFAKKLKDPEIKALIKYMLTDFLPKSK